MRLLTQSSSTAANTLFSAPTVRHLSLSTFKMDKLSYTLVTLTLSFQSMSSRKPKTLPQASS